MPEKIFIKTTKDLKTMAEGGKKLARIKKRLKEQINVGMNAGRLEAIACELIKQQGGKASFKMVPEYSWCTCVNVNSGLVHGIPKDSIVFKKGDVISVDVGLFYKGFHTDTSFTLGLGLSDRLENFLSVGKNALKNAIEVTKVGNRIFDISLAIEKTLIKDGLTPVRALVGHGIGKNLHEGPQIPCFTSGNRNKSSIIKKGMALAIEVMYTTGNPEVVIDPDGWTISVRNDKISALFEETVAVSAEGSLVLT